MNLLPIYLSIRQTPFSQCWMSGAGICVRVLVVDVDDEINIVDVLKHIPLVAFMQFFLLFVSFIIACILLEGIAAMPAMPASTH